jgi:hypothetical protein
MKDVNRVNGVEAVMKDELKVEFLIRHKQSFIINNFNQVHGYNNV